MTNIKSLTFLKALISGIKNGDICNLNHKINDKYLL